jgi:hypothetical protein
VLPLQNAGAEYYATATVLGSLGPSSRQTAFKNTAENLVTTGSLYSKRSSVFDISGQNMSDYLLQRSDGFEKSEFFRKNVLSASFIPGAIWLDDACAVRSSNAYSAVASINIAAGGAYVFQRVAADFGNLGATDTFSVECPVACNSTGGTEKAFCDFNAAGADVGGTWEQQCGNNPLVQWVELTPEIAEVGQSYTLTCTGGTTLIANVVAASDSTRFNTYVCLVSLSAFISELSPPSYVLSYVDGVFTKGVPSRHNVQ